mgnify:CR=1 FL=1
MGGIFFVLTIAYFVRNTWANEPSIVHTNYGDILGYQTDLARVYRGVPFAQPPINELRYFKVLFFSHRNNHRSHI